VYWRKINGPNADYNTWRQYFGNTSGGSGGSGGLGAAPVPEPSAAILLLLSLPFAGWRRRRKTT
jgi:hypothetical protein